MNLSLMIQNLLHFIAAGQKDLGGLHPAIVHFPIALLTTAPIFILLGLVFKKSSKLFYQTSLILILLGTMSAYLAFFTGYTAGETQDIAQSAFPTLKKHYLLAEQTRFIFSILTGVFLAFISCYSFLTKKFSQKIITLIAGIYLTAYIFCLLFLLNTAHYGGMLVHKHGVKSTLYSK